MRAPLLTRRALLVAGLGAGALLAAGCAVRAGTRASGDRSSFDDARVARAAYRRGLMVRVSGPNLILSPPLVITTDELEQLADMLEAAFDEAGAQRGAGA